MERYFRSTRDDDDDDDNNHNSKGKETWMSCSHYGRGGAPFSGGSLGGFSWPQRSYSCSFCRREFRSAQALGGHMNVHRRDKARLRESPPSGPSLLNTNPNPNLGSAPIPNLNMPPPSSATGNSRHTPVTCEFPSELSPLIHLSPSSASTSTGEGLKIMETGKALSGIEEFKDLDEDGSKVVSLDLEIGVSGDYGYVDDLDLELRLGYTY